jgi:hypothetical protein
MKKELDEALCRDFPLLFKDRNASMMQTCMCWGFDFFQGWEPIVREAAKKLEPLIQKFIDDHPNLSCRVCGCAKDKHLGSATCEPKQCLAFHPHFRADKDQALTVGNINDYVYACWCQKYEGSYPTSSQVKEKYGTLHWYMSTFTDEMDEIISAAEAKSAVTCEVCGEPGELRDVGWLFTYCDKHYEMAERGWKIYQDEEEWELSHSAEENNISREKEKQVEEWTKEYTEEVDG